MNKTVPELANRWLKRNPESLSELERRVLQSTVDRKPISQDINDSLAGLQGAGDLIADAIARIGGSWTFILSFIAFLNLMLSMLAALQAPVIMMSQNRQAEHDRIDAAHDYEVNLKAEIEIMALHEKLDELRHSQIIGMRDEIAQIAEQLKRIDERLTPQTQPS